MSGRARRGGADRGWWRLITPRDNTSQPFTAEQLYAAIHASTGPSDRTQLVLAGTYREVGIWLGAETERLDALASLLRATYPDLELDRQPPPLPGLADASADGGDGEGGRGGTGSSAGSGAGSRAGGEAVAARWALAEDPAYPIKTVRAFEASDPIAMLLGPLGDAAPGDTIVLSLVLTRGPAGFAAHSMQLADRLLAGQSTGPWWDRALAGAADGLASTISTVLSGPPNPHDPYRHGAAGAGWGAGPGYGAGAGAGGRLPQADLETRVKWIGSKAAQPVFRATLLTAAASSSLERARRSHAAVAAALGQFTVPNRNSLIPSHVSRRGAIEVWDDIRTARAPRREKTVLGIDELAGIIHLPGPDTIIPYLPRAGARHRAPAHPSAADALSLAAALHRTTAASTERAGYPPGDAYGGIPAVVDAGGPAECRAEGRAVLPVGVSVADLMSHAYVVGPSGTGKTTLLAHLCLQLADTGCAQIVLDPHGDLAHQILARIPEEHLDRTVLLDLADPGNLPTLNPLWIPDPPPGTDPREAAVARAVAAATRTAAVRAVFADLWGLHRANTPNLLHFLDAALAALVGAQANEQRGTLADLPRLLTDPDYRRSLVRAAADPRVTARWVEFDQLGREDKSRTIRAILNKAADFDRNPTLGTVFGDPGPGLRIDQLMDTGQILIVSLPRGLVPEGTVELIGSVLVSLAYQAALAREARPADQRPPVVAVIDEFQEFALTTFAKALTATRKYGLGLVVANQNLSRIREISPDLLDTLLANVATMVAFRTAPADAEVLAPYVSPYEPADLVALAPGETYWRTPGRRGPHTTAAAIPPLSRPLRTPQEVAAIARRLRPRGVPLRIPTPSASLSRSAGASTGVGAGHIDDPDDSTDRFDLTDDGEDRWT